VRQVPRRCPAEGCGDPDFKQKGMGTERIEAIMKAMFKKAVVKRMDSDTMTRKDSYQQILGQFRTGKIDILVGTQMIAKGLHFPNVTLVGVINADTTLHMPDFRAGERTFQLITQVSGRAGRGEIAGEVFIQTYTPSHPAIQAARTLDYDNFMDQELEFRRALKYPPYAHMVCMTIRCPDEALCELASSQFYKMLEPMLDSELVISSSPTPAPIAKMKGSFRFQIIMRAEYTKRMTVPLRHALKHFKWPPKVSFVVDVDALSLM
jgi:primosomal protein N' (replication factor Y)